LGYLVEAQNSRKEITENYRSTNPLLEPNVTLVVNAGSSEFTLGYVVDYTKRTAMKDQLFTKIIEEIADSNWRLEWTLSGVTFVNQPAAPDAIEAHPSPSTRNAGHGRGCAKYSREPPNLDSESRLNQAGVVNRLFSPGKGRLSDSGFIFISFLC